MRIIFLLLAFANFIGCRKDTAKSSTRLISDLLIKYPALGLQGEGRNTDFTLIRYIKDNTWGAEFELYKAGNFAEALLIRKNNLTYSIPLFGNEYPGYWSADSTLNKNDTKRFTTTFEKELKESNKKLNLSRIEFIYFRYIFIQVLGLREESYPDPCAKDFNLPAQILYTGNYYHIIETLHSRDSITLKAERIFGVD